MATTGLVLTRLQQSDKRKAEMCRKITEHQRNMEWLAARYDMLRKEYKNMFVAVHDKRVVASCSSIAELHKEMVKHDFVDVAAISYIYHKRPVMILWES